jgi:pectinesterase
MNKTIISWNDTAGDFDDADVLLKTYRSATVGISSEWFIAEGVTFVVSWCYSIAVNFSVLYL